MDGESVEVDDLFGDTATLEDAVALNLPLHSIPVEGLAQYVDDLHRASAEQSRVQWSRLGCVASVAQDALSASLRHLTFLASERKWGLSKEHFIDLGADGETQHPILQLEWSQSGADLALADAAGRITIVNASSMALNGTTILHSAADREDEPSQALAMYWLNVERQYPTYLSTLKEQGKWTYTAAKRRTMGPSWIRAVLVVTRRGTIVLHYQRLDGRWAIARADLRSLNPTGSLLTHAAIAPTQENKLLIATQNSSRQLLVYLVTLNLPDPRTDPRMATGVKILVDSVRGSVPYKSPKNASSETDESLLFDASSHFLSHLVVVPTTDVEKALQLPPTISAFYTPLINSMGLANDGQLGMTTVRRWHVVSAEQKLHPTFDSMPSRSAPTIASRRTDLSRLEDIHLNQLITTVQKIDGGEHLALGAADGSLTLFDPNTFTPIFMSSDSAQVTSMAQAGFAFPTFPRGLNQSVSPNACLAANLGSDGKIQLTHLEHPSGLTFDSTDPAMIEAPVAAIILAFARSVYAQVSLNDIMLLITQNLDHIHYPQLVQATLRDLLNDRDFIHGQEISSYSSRPIVVRVLSLTASLGHDPLSGQRSVPSMLSWLSLNIRFCTLIVMRIWASLKQNGGIEWKDTAACDIACKNLNWILDLCKFIVDNLFEMADATDSASGPDQDPGSSTATGSITMLLLFSIWPHSFLKIIPRFLRGIVRATQDPKSSLSPDAAPAFSRMAKLVEASSLKMEPLEHLLSGVEKVVQQAYKVSGMSDHDKANAERFMLSHGQVPEVLQDVVPSILQDVLGQTRANMNRLSLYMDDYSWLGVGQDSKAKIFKRDFVVDVHRKVVIRRKDLVKARKCVRCGSISTDLVKPKHWPQYLQMLGSRCVCDDYFAIVGSAEL